MANATAIVDSEPSVNSVIVDRLGVTFANGFVGLRPTTLQIKSGDFCTLLGPSGSGKTTLLRAIAGLTTPTSGRIVIKGSNVTHLPVQARNIGFVFQNYALFPHMSVTQNIEYPLRLHKWDAADRQHRVREILELIELPHLGDRPVGDLSGGQQQRVAIGRALSYRPALLLLDEPMGALDRRLRQQLGAQLRELQQKTGITAIYVTHDQEEAFILSDKIAVMNHGEILQYSTPDELYFWPSSRFVAQFLGEANLVDALDVGFDNEGNLTARTQYGPIRVRDGRRNTASSGALTVIIRPEHVHLQDKSNRLSVPVHVTHELFLGSRSLVTVRADDGKAFLVECDKHQVPPSGSTSRMTWSPGMPILLDRQF